MNTNRRTLARLAFCTGVIAVTAVPVTTQITIKCWKEACITDPDTGKTSCIREEIPCPTAT